METIKSSAEISRLFNEGRRIGTKDVLLIVLRNDKQHGHSGRAAFIAGKKLGNAVWRNRAKRRLRAACRMVTASVADYDMLFIARKTTTSANFETMVRDLNRALSRIERR